MAQIGLCGANGRMGKAIENIVSKFPFEDVSVCARFIRGDSEDHLTLVCNNSDVVIDFSHPDLLTDLLDKAVLSKTPLVIGTTGFNELHLSSIQKASLHIPILCSSNMSVGANLIAKLAKEASSFLGLEYDVAISEKHHKRKKDAPSGTALMIGRAIGRNDIEFSSVRVGKIFGEHEVIFAGEHEIITVKHQALDRELFALGAVKAAIWILDQRVGLYSQMFD